MNIVHQKMIDAIIQKAGKVCPNSLVLIGLYGSVATGDIHEKSDLDLLILINDDHGWQLADAFLLDDAEIGYDLYCTTWAMLEEDACCNHAHLSKLLDSTLIYVKDPSAIARLAELQNKARELLASDERYAKAQNAFANAKKIFADCFLSNDLAQIRVSAGAVIYFLLDSVMLHHGRYFQKGVKRTFEEISLLDLAFDMLAQCMAVIQAKSAEKIRVALSELMRSVQNCLTVLNEKAVPSPKTLSGTYEEMFSNWRNKMQEAAEQNDLFFSFMNMVSFQFVHQELAETLSIEQQNLMEYFDPDNIRSNAQAFDNALSKHLKEYEKAGIQPKHFANVDAFVSQYQRD